MKGLAAIVGLLIISAGAYLYLTQAPASEQEGTVTQGENDTSSDMRAEENAVMVFEQRPGNTVSGSVFLAAPGYLVIHEDAGGNPGAIIGSSAILPAGESATTVHLSRAMKDGEMLHAMLHFEKGNNSNFSPAEDTPVPSRLGGPIKGYFDVSVDAPINPPITI